MLESFILLIFLLILLNFFTRRFIYYLLNLATYFNLSYFLISFIFGGVTTSLPELLIGLQSAFKKTNTLSLGNILGANITDLSFVLGIALISLYLTDKNLLIPENTVKLKLDTRQFLATVLVTLTPFILLLDGFYSRWEAFLSLVLFFIYFYFLYKQNKLPIDMLSTEFKFKKFFTSLVSCLLLGGLIIILSYVIVQESLKIVQQLQMSSLIFGTVILSLGTTIPELLFSLQSIKRRIPELVLGNLIGSVAFNSNFILGLSALIWPLTFHETFKLLIEIIFLILVMLSNFYFIYRQRFKILSALWLISLWLLFIVFNVFFLLITW